MTVCTPSVAALSLGLAVLLATAGCHEILPRRTEGEKLYRKHCADCHGVSGTGTPRYMGTHAADLTDRRWKTVSGIDGSMKIFLHDGEFGVHDEYGDELSGEEIEAVMDHLRTLEE